MTQYVLAVDQGTTSTRAIIFDHSGSIVSVGQKEHEQIFPRAGWVEHNPVEISENTRFVIGQALAKADLNIGDLAAVGITNQRETAVVWDKHTGEPVYNAIVWQDTRTQAIVEELGALGGGAERYRPRSVCLWRPTSPARRSAGSSTTSRARGPGPRPVTCCSATPTRGRCGTSRAVRTAACTRPT